MGQTPSRPSQQTPSTWHHNRQEAGMDISHLPDPSPFKRKPKSATDPALPKSTALGGRCTSRLSSEGRRVRKKEGASKSRTRRAERERCTLGDVKDRTTEVSRRKRRSINRGTGQSATEPSPRRLEAIPRIDIVESSPLLGVSATKESANDARCADPPTITMQSPAPPVFPRSPSMPAILQEPSPAYSLPPASSRPSLERPISSPHISSSGLAPQLGMLPLPGTPISDLILAERPQQDYLHAFVSPAGAGKPVISAQAGSVPASRCASFHHMDDCDSVGSVITQQIKILRVTNPDIEEEEKAGASLLGGESAVDLAGKRTLAEKRKVSAPPALMTPMTPQKASRLSPTLANRLSPVAPSSATSSSYNNSSSDLLSPSTAATSLSPTSPRGKSSKTSLYPVRAVPPVPGTVTPGIVRPFLISRTARKPSAEHLKLKNEETTRVRSGDSSNADESEECSTVSAMSDDETTMIQRRKRRQGVRSKAHERKGRLAIGNGQTSVSKTKGPGFTHESQERRVSAPLPPPIHLLDIVDRENVEPDWRRVSLGAPPYAQAPVSPRPPATPFLPNGPNNSFPRLPAPGTPGPMPNEEKTLDLYEPLQQQSAYFLPPPPSLQMDGFTTELLSRCGVEIDTAQPHASLPHPGSRSSLASHPSILRPTNLSSSRLPSERRIVSLPIDYISAPPRELLVEAGAVIEKALPVRAGIPTEQSTSAVRHERAARRAEKAARYEAFRQLAMMAVESPQGNPYVELSTGAVRLGEYKRGFDGYEIERWAQRVQQAVRDEDSSGDRAGRRVRRECAA